jgi:hypothetical protein
MLCRRDTLDVLKKGNEWENQGNVEKQREWAHQPPSLGHHFEGSFWEIFLTNSMHLL